MRSEQRTDQPTAIIIGGGIGGLAAAIALRRVGVSASVYERADAVRDDGAGLWLWANAARALAQLGLAETVRAVGRVGVSGAIRSWRGQPLVRSVGGDGAADSTITLLRGELVGVLRAALPDGVVQTGTPCLAVAQEDERVIARFADGTTATADLLIGADGLHSVVRAGLHGQQLPRYAGYYAYRAVVTDLTNQIPPGVSWGCGARFGIMPLRNGRVNWFAGVNAPLGAPPPVAALLDRYRAWRPPVADLLAATDPATILVHPIVDRDPLPHWGAGRITLLGDAAHPMTPSLGQGACLALEDAIVLAAMIRDHGAIPAALRAYERQRIPRTTAVARLARRMDRLSQLDIRPLCALRDQMVRATPTAWRTRTFGWVLDYQAPALAWPTRAGPC